MTIFRCLTCGHEYNDSYLECPVCGHHSSIRVPDDVTPDGGIHAHVEGRYDLIPPEAMKAIAMVMEEGVQNGRDASNWRKVPYEVQINHALAHLVAAMMNETDEDHLAHCLTRLAMSVAVRKESIK
jgi:predicted  nucleic acid-binding Zn-ribbon protein